LEDTAVGMMVHKHMALW